MDPASVMEMRQLGELRVAGSSTPSSRAEMVGARPFVRMYGKLFLGLGHICARKECYNLTLTIPWPPGSRIRGQVALDAGDGNTGLDASIVVHQALSGQRLTSYVGHITGYGRIRSDADVSGNDKCRHGVI